MDDVSDVNFVYSYDEYYEQERAYLLEVIREINKNYQRAAQPYIDRLAELESVRIPLYWIKYPDGP